MNILLGITGGIAAYKAPQLVRLLVEYGHGVGVVGGESGKEVVSPRGGSRLGHTYRKSKRVRHPTDTQYSI